MTVWAIIPVKLLAQILLIPVGGELLWRMQPIECVKIVDNVCVAFLLFHQVQHRFH